MKIAEPSGIFQSSRIPGYDLAKGIALCAMLFINFKCVFCYQKLTFGWLMNWVDFLDRRAAVVLVMASGAGVSLMACRSKSVRQWKIDAESRMILLKRAAFLACAGYLLSFLWAGDILHFYAAFMLAGIFLTRLTDFNLFAAVFISWLIGFLRFFDGISDIFEEPDKGFIIEQLQDIFFTGYFPFFPWIVFFAVGIWIGRHLTDSAGFRNRIMAAGIFMLAASECIAIFAMQAAEHIDHFTLRCFLSALLESNLVETTPLSAISGVGTGMSVIAFGSWLSEKQFHRLNSFLIILGRTSLSLYLFHISFILTLFYFFNIKQIHNGIIALGANLGFAIVYVTAIKSWLKSHRKGPFEGLIRKVSSPGNFEALKIKNKLQPEKIRIN